MVVVSGKIDFDRLELLSNLVGKNRLVIDLSCRKKKQTEHDTSNSDNAIKTTEDSQKYYVVTNKWTKYTDFEVTLVTTIIYTVRIHYL